MSRWVSVQDRPPPEGVIVEATDRGGHVHRLVRKGNLYFFPDMSMYVYFVPVEWRATEKGNGYE